MIKLSTYVYIYRQINPITNLHIYQSTYLTTSHLSIYQWTYLYTNQLSIYQSSIYLSISQPIYLSINLSTYLSTYQPIYLPINLSIFLSTYLSTLNLSIYQSFIYISIYQSLSIYHLSVYITWASTDNIGFQSHKSAVNYLLWVFV